MERGTTQTSGMVQGGARVNVRQVGEHNSSLTEGCGGHVELINGGCKPNYSGTSVYRNGTGVEPAFFIGIQPTIQGYFGNR